jgi:hypothetical protein
MTVLTEATMPWWHILCFVIVNVALVSLGDIGPSSLPMIVATELIHLKLSGARAAYVSVIVGRHAL